MRSKRSRARAIVAIIALGGGFLCPGMLAADDAGSATRQANEMRMRCAQEDPALVAIFDAQELVGGQPFLRPSPGMVDWRTTCSKEWHEVYNGALDSVGILIKTAIVQTSDADLKVVRSWLAKNPCSQSQPAPVLPPSIRCDTRTDSTGSHTRCSEVP
jgi:hypothetical protein